MRPAQLAAVLCGLAGLGFLAGGLALLGHGPAATVFLVLGGVFLAFSAFWLVMTRRKTANGDTEQGGRPDGT